MRNAKEAGRCILKKQNAGSAFPRFFFLFPAVLLLSGCIGSLRLHDPIYPTNSKNATNSLDASARAGRTPQRTSRPPIDVQGWDIVPSLGRQTSGGQWSPARTTPHPETPSRGAVFRRGSGVACFLSM